MPLLSFKAGVFMFKTLKWAAAALPVLSILFAGGCGIQSSHPNQINAFDGATYDGLLLAHGALTSVQANVTASYPKYAPIFNQARAAYGMAYAAYATFRTAPTTQAEVAVTIGNLTVAIVALENGFENDMQASTTNVAHIRLRAKRLRASAKQAGLSVSDILTELEIAAAVARTIPQVRPYAAIAQLVIESTSSALAAEIAAAGQPIELTLIQPIPAIP
jgi:hypothetical protein